MEAVSFVSGGFEGIISGGSRPNLGTHIIAALWKHRSYLDAATLGCPVGSARKLNKGSLATGELYAVVCILGAGICGVWIRPTMS